MYRNKMKNVQNNLIWRKVSGWLIYYLNSVSVLIYYKTATIDKKEKVIIYELSLKKNVSCLGAIKKQFYRIFNFLFLCYIYISLSLREKNT